MDWFRQVDDYCERTDFTFWSEPLNAITNAGFLIAALLALQAYNRLHARTGRKPRWVLVLILVIASISLGSFLFHTYATIWAMWADIVPILLFIYIFHAVFMFRAFEWPRWFIAFYLVGLYALSAQIEQTIGRDLLHGSLSYAPALLSFAFVTMAMFHYRRPGAERMAAALAIFFASLIFRTLDLEICDHLPIGTHFVWHILNSMVLYLLLTVLIYYYTGKVPSKERTKAA